MLTRTLMYHTKDSIPVEDLAQECWYTIIKRLDEVDLKISFDAWALTIVRRKAIDWIREQQRSRRYSKKIKKEFNSKAKERNRDKQEEKLAQIDMGIQQLSPTQRIVLTMFYRENLSLQEISTVLDISEGTVKSRLFYARENLKKILNQQTEN